MFDKSGSHRLRGYLCLLGALGLVVVLLVVNRSGGYELLHAPVDLQGNGDARLPFSVAGDSDYILGLEMLQPGDRRLNWQVVTPNGDSPLMVDWSVYCVGDEVARGDAREAVNVRLRYGQAERLQGYLLGLASYVALTKELVARVIGKFELKSGSACEVRIAWREVESGYSEARAAVFVRRQQHAFDRRLQQSQFLGVLAGLLFAAGGLFLLRDRQQRRTMDQGC